MIQSHELFDRIGIPEIIVCCRRECIKDEAIASECLIKCEQNLTDAISKI